MRIEMHARGFELTDALRAYAERRLHYALRLDNARVRRVALNVEDVNGPRGGIDKRCRIQVMLNGWSPLVVHETQADAYGAIDRASKRIGRTVDRLLDRARVGQAVSRAARRGFAPELIEASNEESGSTP
ncbi:MAG: HPF/RaiA family ribosome-associated protein [Burkholderiales bacterium]